MFRVPDICLRAVVESASPVRCECGRVFVTRLSVRITQATRCLGKTYHHYEAGTLVIQNLSIRNRNSDAKENSLLLGSVLRRTQ